MQTPDSRPRSEGRHPSLKPSDRGKAKNIENIGDLRWQTDLTSPANVSEVLENFRL